MKLHPHLKLRRLGNMYMIVDTRTGQVNMTNVYNLNATAAALWREAEAIDFTAEQLAEYLCREYEVAYDVALHDVRETLETWARYGLLMND